MAKYVHYRFETFISPNSCSRVEIEHGETDDWVYIRRQSHILAAEHNEPVLLYIYNDYLRKWEYIGKAYPGGDWYDFNGGGPYVLSSDGSSYIRKGGEA